MALESFGVIKTEKELEELLNINPESGTKHEDFAPVLEKFHVDFYTRMGATITDIAAASRENYIVVVNFIIPEERCGHYSIAREIIDNKIIFFDPWLGKNHSYETSYFESVWKSWDPAESEQHWFLAMKK